jgi:hypothetical protein
MFKSFEPLNPRITRKIQSTNPLSLIGILPRLTSLIC